MDALSQEKAMKKKLQSFLLELQQFGTLKGFKHFQCYVRSREELVVSVNNTLQDATATSFLIAGYARYSGPYVWILSNHERLLQVSSDKDSERDSPLRLKSTARWKDGDVLVTDVIAEVVMLNTYPAPWNPFEIDLQYFQSLSQSDQFLCSAAMVACLQKIVVHTPDSKPYTTKVFEDLQHIIKFHFSSLGVLVAAANIPILQQNCQQHQQNHQDQEKYQYQNTQYYQQQQRRHSLQSRYPRFPATLPPTQPPVIINPSNSSGIIYGQGFGGIFPGGFNRMPAPSIL